MKLTKKAVKAIEASIEHWEKDMIAKFKEGRRVVGGRWDDGSEFKDGAKYCPLCIAYRYCSKCPYFLYYGRLCDSLGEVWGLWRRNPCLETAQDVVNALKKMLEGK